MKQRDSCAICNDNYCICCGIEKTARRDAMCETCLSKIKGTSVEEIHLASMMCFALYGDGSKLGDVSVKKIDGSGTPFDMVLSDISDDVIVIEHDSVFYHQDDKIESDEKKVKCGLEKGCIVVRHRHVDCPKLDIEHDDFHLVEFNGYSDKSNSRRLALSLVENIINLGILNDECMENAVYFILNSEEFSEVSKENANEFIRTMVLG